MITVIATGFDGRRRQDAARPSAAERLGGAAAVRQSAAATSGTVGAPIPARDFLDELERQRSEAAERGAGVPSRPERTVGEQPARRPATTYDADDLEIPSFLRRR